MAWSLCSFNRWSLWYSSYLFSVQVFVNQLADVIHLQVLQSGDPGSSTWSTFLLHLLSIINLLTCLATLTSTYAASTSSQYNSSCQSQSWWVCSKLVCRSKWKVKNVCSNQWRLVQAVTSYWYALKIIFAVCLVVSIRSEAISSKEDMEGEEKRLLIIIAASTIFLIVVQKLIKDLAVLSTLNQVHTLSNWCLLSANDLLQEELQSGLMAYSLLTSKEAADQIW